MAANNKRVALDLDWTFRRAMAGAGLTLSALTITTVFLPKSTPLDIMEWLSLGFFGVGLLAGAGCFYVDVIVHATRPAVRNDAPLATRTFTFAVASIASAGVGLLFDISHLVASNGVVGLWVILIPAAIVVGLQLNLNSLIASARQPFGAARKPRARRASRPAAKRPNKPRARVKPTSRRKSVT